MPSVSKLPPGVERPGQGVVVSLDEKGNEKTQLKTQLKMKKQFKMKKESGLKTLLKKALAENDPGIISGHGSLLSRDELFFPEDDGYSYKAFAVVPDGMFLLPMVKSGVDLHTKGAAGSIFHHVTSDKYNNYYPPGV